MFLVLVTALLGGFYNYKIEQGRLYNAILLGFISVTQDSLPRHHGTIGVMGVKRIGVCHHYCYHRICDALAECGGV